MQRKSRSPVHTHTLAKVPLVTTFFLSEESTPKVWQLPQIQGFPDFGVSTRLAATLGRVPAFHQTPVGLDQQQVILTFSDPPHGST